jgi:hypothetical protein
MSNSNCLDGLRCPRCGQEDRLDIVARVMCRVTDDGSEPFGDHDWDDDSVAVCPGCGCDGRLGDFRVRPDMPPDPEGMNDARATWAGVALSAFLAETGCDIGDAVTDLLSDLMHWCDRNGQEFRTGLDRARLHYEAETQVDGS